MKPHLRHALYTLWQTAFPDDAPAFIDLYFKLKANESNTIVRYVEGEVAAACQVIRYDINFYGEKRRAAYISGLATRPAYRGKGLATAILHEAHECLLKEGVDFCFLIPGDATLRRYYAHEARGGYETCSYRKRTTHPLSDMKPNSSYIIREEAPNAPHLYPFYRKKMEAESFALISSSKDFYAALATYQLEGGRIFSAWQNDELKGYLVAVGSKNTCILREAPSMAGKAFESLAAHACRVWDSQSVSYPEFSATPSSCFLPYAMVKLLRPTHLKEILQTRGKSTHSLCTARDYFQKNALSLWHLIDE